MPSLRPSAIQQVLEELAASKFGTVSFDAVFPDAGDLASITFTVRKGSRFVISSSGTVSHPVQVRMSPGEYKSEDVVRCESFRDCLKLIQPWTRRIHEDLKVQDPHLEDLQRFRESLDSHIRDNLKEEGKLFSAAEADDLAAKLDLLSERLTEMESRHEITEFELQKLQAVLADAKSDIPEMPKGVWYRTSGGKVWEAMKKVASTSEARQVLAEAAKKLIGM